MNNNYYKDINTTPNYVNKQYQFNSINKNIEEVMLLNKGKKVSIYTSFTNTNGGKEEIFTGIIEDSYKDYVVLSDPKIGNWYIIPIKYINFIKFDENINNNSFYP